MIMLTFSYENEFNLHENELTDETHFHNGYGKQSDLLVVLVALW